MENWRNSGKRNSASSLMQSSSLSLSAILSFAQDDRTQAKFLIQRKMNKTPQPRVSQVVRRICKKAYLQILTDQPPKLCEACLKNLEILHLSHVAKCQNTILLSRKWYNTAFLLQKSLDMHTRLKIGKFVETPCNRHQFGNVIPFSFVSCVHCTM